MGKPTLNALGTVVAERTLERPGSKRPVRARLGQPRPARRAPWECRYQVMGGRDARVRVAYGEDALQALLLACVGLRIELESIQASWFGLKSGIPPFLPDFLGAAFTTHLEGVVEREVEKFTARLKRTHERNTRRATARTNQAVRPARDGRVRAK